MFWCPVRWSVSSSGSCQVTCWWILLSHIEWNPPLPASLIFPTHFWYGPLLSCLLPGIKVVGFTTQHICTSNSVKWTCPLFLLRGLRAAYDRARWGGVSSSCPLRSLLTHSEEGVGQVFNTMGGKPLRHYGAIATGIDGGEREICSVDKPFSSELIAVRAGKGRENTPQTPRWYAVREVQ